LGGEEVKPGVFHYLHGSLMMRKAEHTHQVSAGKNQGLDSNLYSGDFGFDSRQGQKFPDKGFS
jgi:hypothetical protein